MKVSPRQMEAILASPGVERFEHFIKVIADWQELWGLYQDGWALSVADDGTTVFPLWPAKEYAQLCALNEWKGFEPRAITLIDLTDVLLPKLKLEGVLPGVFFTPASKGVTLPVDELMAALRAELRKY
ncbi:DUF2750 domain-containing protein [Sinorhizobium meliloti]|uniref:DUF2750 domain-containing protein n=1 Tax=Rhizobium meliloti TaxID=382 RepID=UPI000B49EAF3|nr:DUF2750 domain-containing protein [Sinorhizobium meliloti]ASP98529.1 DUF2750 domain-containing protein [Sinorhizobium meliloti]MDW9532419.1 DUF2750 domain-containing protein [Sinorhizobium meliloti]MDW9581650.1 DUF2750 domain-containing protein [Sinorhizobium meliloti]MDW9706158.1 DUF2750 domain-containing protein [Sinorhizobium meliloti]MDW9816710.1 DUF2750 domain-containing protein [Sinorhizobium meliloti]